MSHEFDPWATSTGLLESYTGKIVDAIFAFDPSYNNGQALLLKLDINTGDAEIGEGGIVSEQYSVGKGWDTQDGGKSTFHESNQARNFNVNSGVGLLLESIRDAGGMPALQAKGTLPTEASTWVGGTYSFERKEFSFKTSEGKDQEYARKLVTSVLPEGAAQDAPAPAPAPASAPAGASPSTSAPAATPAHEPGSGHDVPVGVKCKLKTLAVNSPTHEAFVEAAFTGDYGVIDNPALEAAVADEAWYKGLRGE